MRRHHNHAVLFEAQDKIPDIAANVGVLVVSIFHFDFKKRTFHRSKYHARGRLIQVDNLGVADKAESDGEASLHATAKRANGVVLDVEQLNILEAFADDVVHLLVRDLA